MTARLNTMREEIKARRPTDERRLDYAACMGEYQRFVSSDEMNE